MVMCSYILPKYLKTYVKYGIALDQKFWSLIIAFPFSGCKGNIHSTSSKRKLDHEKDLNVGN